MWQARFLAPSCPCCSGIEVVEAAQVVATDLPAPPMSCVGSLLRFWSRSGEGTLASPRGPQQEFSPSGSCPAELSWPPSLPGLAVPIAQGAVSCITIRIPDADPEARKVRVPALPRSAGSLFSPRTGLPPPESASLPLLAAHPDFLRPEIRAGVAGNLIHRPGDLTG